MPVAIPANADLNQYRSPGLFFCGLNATVETLQHCPVRSGFSLLIECGIGGGAVQTLTTTKTLGNNVWTTITYKRNEYVVSSEYSWTVWIMLLTNDPPTKYSIPFTSGITARVGTLKEYCKTQDGIVHIHVSCEKSDNTAIAGGSIILNLPEGFRPSASTPIPVVFTNAAITGTAAGYVNIYSNGVISLGSSFTNISDINKIAFSFSFAAQ